MAVKGIDDLVAQLRAASMLAAGARPEAPNRASAGARVERAERADFGNALKSALGEVSTAQKNALKLAREFELGAPNLNVHDVMIALQKANVSFQGTVQVRNRVVAAYQEIMNMQV